MNVTTTTRRAGFISVLVALALVLGLIALGFWRSAPQPAPDSQVTPAVLTAYQAASPAKVYTGFDFKPMEAKPPQLFIHNDNSALIKLAWKSIGKNVAVTKKATLQSCSAQTCSYYTGTMRLANVMRHNGHKFYQRATFTAAGLDVQTYYYTRRDQWTGKWGKHTYWQQGCPEYGGPPCSASGYAPVELTSALMPQAPSKHNFVTFLQGGGGSFYLAKTGLPGIVHVGNQVHVCYNAGSEPFKEAGGSCNQASHWYQEDIGTIGVDGYEPYRGPIQNTQFKGATMSRYWYMVWDKADHNWRRTPYCLTVMAEYPHYIGSNARLLRCDVGHIQTWEMWQQPEPVVPDYPTYGTVGLVSFGMTRSWAGNHPTSDAEFGLYSMFTNTQPGKRVFIHQFSPGTPVNTAYHFAWVPTRVETSAIKGACNSTANLWPGEAKHRKDESCNRKLVPDDLNDFSAEFRMEHQHGDIFKMVAGWHLHVDFTPQQVSIAVYLQVYNQATGRFDDVHADHYNLSDLPRAGEGAELYPPVSGVCTYVKRNVRWRLIALIQGNSSTGVYYKPSYFYAPSIRGRGMHCR